MKKENRLFSWDSEKKIGFYPVMDSWYDDLYFEASIQNSLSKIAKPLYEFRASIINKYASGKVLDFGTGCGAFLAYRKNTVGYDICPKSIDYLKKEKLFFDFYRNGLDGIDGIAFFDVLEHIKNADSIFKRITSQHVFISLPLFRNKAHVLKSKHFKVNEHFWYFTLKSINSFIEKQGFEIIEERNDETIIGREDIFTFVIKRKYCQTCYWFNFPTVPHDKERYGNNGICQNLKCKKDSVSKHSLVCDLYLNETYLWDDNKRAFVSGDDWKPRPG